MCTVPHVSTTVSASRSEAALTIASASASSPSGSPPTAARGSRRRVTPNSDCPEPAPSCAPSAWRCAFLERSAGRADRSRRTHAPCRSRRPGRYSLCMVVTGPKSGHPVPISTAGRKHRREAIGLEGGGSGFPRRDVAAAAGVGRRGVLDHLEWGLGNETVTPWLLAKVIARTDSAWVIPTHRDRRVRLHGRAATGVGLHGVGRVLHVRPDVAYGLGPPARSFGHGARRMVATRVGRSIRHRLLPRDDVGGADPDHDDR